MAGLFYCCFISFSILYLLLHQKILDNITPSWYNSKYYLPSYWRLRRTYGTKWKFTEFQSVNGIAFEICVADNLIKHLYEHLQHCRSAVCLQFAVNWGTFCSQHCQTFPCNRPCHLNNDCNGRLCLSIQSNGQRRKSESKAELFLFYAV